MSTPKPASTSPAAVRRVAKLSLVLTGLLALATILCELCQRLPLEWSISVCKAVCPHLDASIVRGIALIILLVLVGAQRRVHKLDGSNINEGSAAGIVGRYRQLKSGAAAGGSVAPAPLGGPVQTADEVAAAVARGIALAKAEEKEAARAKQVNARFHETDKSAVRAFMSKQSVFAALSLFLLKAVSTHLPPVFPKSLEQWIYVASAGGFLFTLLTVLAAIQTYSTYVRIQWDEGSSIELLNKGRRFDEASFYALTISLLAVLCAYQPWAALVTLPAFGMLMYRYYFFRA